MIIDFISITIMILNINFYMNSEVIPMAISNYNRDTDDTHWYDLVSL